MIKTMGLVDIHFHGAFGIDCMSAPESDLNELSSALWKRGIGAFCPTTLSAPPNELLKSVERLGKWIKKRDFRGAIPLGIHLEGPFISSNACGAHPPHTIRLLDEKELSRLWLASQGTLKILTLAPEQLSESRLKKLAAWCQQRKIILSLGHSNATQEEAKVAFLHGFKGVTHAWNALPFHQREPGVLGAALGKKDVYLELIMDRAHVSPAVLRWTLQIHPLSHICFISDCISAGGTSLSNSKKPGPWTNFGPLKVRFQDGACRLPNGQLAGGGLLLSDSFTQWIQSEASDTGTSVQKLLKSQLRSVTENPLAALGLSKTILKNRQVAWRIDSFNQIHLIPIDSTADTI